MSDGDAGWSKRDAEGLYRSLLAALPDGVLVQAGGRIVHANPAALRMLRAASLAELGGGAVSDLVHPDQREGVRIRLAGALDGATGGGSPLAHRDIKLVARDGTAVDADLVATECTLRNEPAVQVVLRDVRERRRLEREREGALDDLRRSRGLLDRAQMIGSFGLWNSEWEDEPDGKGRLWWSPEVFRITGVDPAQFDGRNATFFDLVVPEDREGIRESVRRAAAQHAPYEFEHRILRPDGEERWLHEWALVEYDADGRPMLLVGLCQDVTERRRADIAMAEARRLESVGKLAGGIAHDFNNLLGVLLGGLDMASREVRPGSVAEEMIRDCRSAATEASELVRELLAYAQRQSSSPQTIDLREVIARALPVLQRLAGGGISIRVLDEGGLWPARIDPVQLEHALVNLVSNARDAMPDGGEIRVGTRNIPGGLWDSSGSTGAGDEEDRVELTVEDDGPGLDATARARVFEPFAAPQVGGMRAGLGLATVNSIVAQAGGTITAESAPGRGTVFRIRLPRSREEVAQLPAAIAAAPAGGTERVLLVEDREELRRLTVLVLSSAGYDVVAAGDAEEGLGLASSHAPPEVLVTDVVLPGMDGRQLVEAIRRKLPHLPVVFISGYNEDRKLSAVPHSTFLGKPYAPEDLLRAIRGVIAAR